MLAIDWYFDFISPYAYFQFQRLKEFERYGELRLHPVLFAGLLKAWEHKGPAEIPKKRSFTYRHATWYARQHNIPFKVPPAHPFAPLPLLRLAHAQDSRFEVVDTIFNFIWRDGMAPGEPDVFMALSASVGVPDPETVLGEDIVKRSLREATDDAIGHGIFGVPTVMIDGELFWGADATDMALDFVRGEPVMRDEEMNRVANLPAEVHRKASHLSVVK
tara:strand:- start:229 stop:882 length:654 start_codon:yes stop_codon:yes gene_type:complete